MYFASGQRCLSEEPLMVSLMTLTTPRLTFNNLYWVGGRRYIETIKKAYTQGLHNKINYGGVMPTDGSKVAASRSDSVNEVDKLLENIFISMTTMTSFVCLVITFKVNKRSPKKHYAKVL